MGELEQSSDLIGQLGCVGDLSLYSKQWPCYIPVASESYDWAEAAISDWDTQIPPRVINWTKLFAQSHQTPFPPREWGLGTRQCQGFYVYNIIIILQLERWARLLPGRIQLVLLVGPSK